MDTSQRGSTDVVNELFDDHSYFYLPYATLSDDDIDAFGQAYRDAVARGVPLTEPILEVTNSASGTVRTLIVLRKGAERWFVTDEPSPGDLQRIKAGIPVIVERPGHHAYSDGSMQGGFVLYFDGHVDFVPYGTWPMTEKTIRILNELDALGARDTIEP